MIHAVNLRVSFHPGEVGPLSHTVTKSSPVPQEGTSGRPGPDTVP